MQDKFILSTIDLEELATNITEAVLRALPEVAGSETQTEDDPRWIKPREAGEIIGHSESFVRKLVREGQLAGYYPGSDLVISKQELIDWMESRKVRSNP